MRTDSNRIQDTLIRVRTDGEQQTSTMQLIRYVVYIQELPKVSANFNQMPRLANLRKNANYLG